MASNDTESTDDCKIQSEILCPWCCSAMDTNAKVCLNCDRHKSKIWEYGKMILTVTGVIGALLTALTFSSEKLVTLYDSIQKPLVHISSFSSEGDTVITNEGRRKVNISHILADVHNTSIISRTTVGMSIDKFESLNINTRSSRTRQAGERNFLDGLNLYPDFPKEMIAFSRCNSDSKIVILSTNSEEYQSIRDSVIKRNATINSLPATCEVFFSPGATSNGELFECVGILGIYGPVKGFLTDFQKYSEGIKTCS